VELATAWIDYQGPDGPVPAYRAQPAMVRDPLPAVIVIQEVWGVDEHIMDVANRVAAAGYLALAPDLFAVGGNRPPALTSERTTALKAFVNTMPPAGWTNPAARAEALQRLPEDERQRIEETMAASFSAGQGQDRDDLGRLGAAVAHLAADPGATGIVASMGFCMGGGLSGQLACREPSLAGAAIFYGRVLSSEELGGLACPLLGFYGGADTRITDNVPAMADAIGRLGGSFEYHVYPGAPHAFFNDTRPSYRVDAARDAWGRLLGFFADRLGPAPA